MGIDPDFLKQSTLSVNINHVQTNSVNPGPHPKAFGTRVVARTGLNMDTFLNRAQRTFGTFSSAASVTAVFVALLSVLQLYASGAWSVQYSLGSVEPRMRWHNSRRFGAVDGREKENARFNFDLEADLSPLFNWNTKQVFTYVTADYVTVSSKTGAESLNSVVIWDKILLSAKSAKLSLHNEHAKYSVYDIQSQFGGSDRTVNLTLRWNVQPKVGVLARGQAAIDSGDASVSLPKQKRVKPPAPA